MLVRAHDGPGPLVGVAGGLLAVVPDEVGGDHRLGEGLPALRGDDAASHGRSAVCWGVAGTVWLLWLGCGRLVRCFLGPLNHAVVA